MEAKHEGVTGEGWNVYRIIEAHRKTIFEGEWWRTGFPLRTVEQYGHPDVHSWEERAEQARIQFHVRIGARNQYR
jgi:hypothetical protein